MKRKLLMAALLVVAATVGVGAGVFLLSGAEVTGGQGGEATAPPRPVRVEEVGPGESVRELIYPGTVKACRTARLSFRVGGPLVDVAVRPGDIVEEGAVLVRIDPRDFRNRIAAIQAQLDAAEARLAAMRAGDRTEDILALEAQLAGAQARLENARLDFERNRGLRADEIVTQADLDRATSAFLTAQAQVAEIEANLVKARAGARPEDIAAMEADIRGLRTELQVAEDQLSDSTLRAPFGGVITKQFVENHEMVTPGQPVVAMHDVSNLEIEVAVPEAELVFRSPSVGYRVRVTFSGIPGRVFEAEVTEWDTEADPQTRTYAVTFSMPQPENVYVLPGMTAEVSNRVLAAGEDATPRPPAVPSSALVVGADGESHVWVLEDGRVRARPVVTGDPLPSGYVIVREGIALGERVVTAGAGFLEEGMAVRALDNLEL